MPPEKGFVGGTGALGVGVLMCVQYCGGSANGRGVRSRGDGVAELRMCCRVMRRRGEHSPDFCGLPGR